MMLRQEIENRAWLAYALTLPLRSIGQSRYYDRKYSHFFTLRPEEFLVFDKDAFGGFEGSYNKSDAIMLTSKFERLRQKSPTVVHVPRLTIENRKVLQSVFVASFRGMYHHSLLIDTVNSQDDFAALALDKFFEDKYFPEIRFYWEEHRNKYLSEAINSFSTNYDIDLVSSTIWSPSDLNVDLKIAGPPSSKKQAWWKL